MSESESESANRHDLWLLRHHITMVVEWAIAKVGQAILGAVLGSFLTAFVAAAANASPGATIGWSSLVGTLVFGFVLANASGPPPIKLESDDDED